MVSTNNFYAYYIAKLLIDENNKLIESLYLNLFWEY